jgi:NifB/MoaA-like Fe-S oxidoreductase
MYDLCGELTMILITVWWLPKFRERLAVNKQPVQKFDGEIFNLRKLNELYVRK